VIQYQDNKNTSKLKSASNHPLFKEGAPKKVNENPETVLIIIIIIFSKNLYYSTMSSGEQ
jgi:hypothetical protein